MVQDRESQFQSSEFRSLLQAAGIKCVNVGIETHNALIEAKRYHTNLRNFFTRVLQEHPNLGAEKRLQLAVKACNDTAGPAKIVPTLFVFGVVPRVPVHPSELQNQRELMIVLHNARKQMAN